MSIKLKDIEKLHSDGLISIEQKAAVIERYNLDSRGMSRVLVYCLSSLSALLIVGGAVMLAISQWNELTPLVKMGSGMSLLALAWLGYFVLRHSSPLVAESLALVGAGAWLANIALIHSLFSPGTPMVESCFVFFIGIAFIPFLVRQRLLVGVTALTSIILFLMMEDAEDSWLSLAFLAPHKMTELVIVCILTLFWWLLAERSRDSQGITQGYAWLGIPAFVAFLTLMHRPLLYDQAFTNMTSIQYGWALYAVPPVLFLLMKPKFAGWFSWLLLMASTSALLPAIEHFSWHHDAVSGLVICGVYALVLVFVGIRCARVAWINYAAFIVILGFIGLIANVLKSIEDSGFVLVVSGVALLVCSLLLETQRRLIVRKIKEKNATPTPSPKA